MSFGVSTTVDLSLSCPSVGRVGRSSSGPVGGPALSAGLVVAMAAGSALAQPCEPGWDNTAGAPGAAGGYIGPVRAWNSGLGELLYAGGSFTAIGLGSGAKYVAAWDASTGVWSRLGTGLSEGFTNAFVTSFAPVRVGSTEALAVGGFFNSAGGLTGTKSLAAWTGSSWVALGSNFNISAAESVWALLDWDGVGGRRLYAGGSFPVAGGVTAGGIAAFDGASWISLGTGVTGSFSPVVFALAAFDGSLYAGGRFDAMNGVSAPLLARWDGASWTKVGGGLIGLSVLFGIEAMTVWDDGSGPALYVAGAPFIPSGQPVASVAKWNGSAWTTIGQNVGGRVTSIAAFDDGTGETLYIGGTATPGIGYFARLEAGQWVPVDTGVSGSISGGFPSVFGLGVWGDRLYVGGSFAAAGSGGLPAAGIVARTSCPECYADCDQSTGAGVLDFFDFVCFADSFALGESYACDCDTGTTFHCDFFDFICFQDHFSLGCP